MAPVVNSILVRTDEELQLQPSGRHSITSSLHSIFLEVSAAYSVCVPKNWGYFTPFNRRPFLFLLFDMLVTIWSFANSSANLVDVVLAFLP